MRVDNGSKNYRIKDILRKLNEIEQFVKEHGSLKEMKTFSSGAITINFWKKINNPSFLKLLSYKDKEIVMEKISNIGLIIYDESKYPINEQSKINYGPILARCLLAFNYLNFNLFTNSKIPNSIIKQVLNNKLYPSQELCENIINFINNISTEHLYYFQEDILKKTKKVYEDLYKEILTKPPKPVEYKVFSDDNLDEYAKLIPSKYHSILEEVKKINYDWYAKYLTYFYVYNISNYDISYDLYFYDGTILKKWYNTQLLFINKNDLEEKQCKLFEVLKKFRETVENEKATELPIEIRNFNKLFSALKEYIEKNEELPRGYKCYVDNISLVHLWQYYGSEVHKKDTLLNEEQIQLVKLLRWYYISLKKEKRQSYKQQKGLKLSLDFHFLIESLGISNEEFASFCGLSFSTFKSYLKGVSKPRISTAKQIISKLESLSDDKYRADQLTDVKNFIIALKLTMEESKVKVTLPKKSIIKEIADVSYNYNDFGDFRKDIESDILESVEKQDNQWYENFIYLFYYVNKELKSIRKSFIINKLLEWYKNQLVMDISYEKKVLLNYIAVCNNRTQVVDKVKTEGINVRKLLIVLAKSVEYFKNFMHIDNVDLFDFYPSKDEFERLKEFINESLNENLRIDQYDEIKEYVAILNEYAIKNNYGSSLVLKK